MLNNKTYNKEIVLPGECLIKFVNIIDQNDNVLSYSYTPLYKFRFSIELPIDKQKHILIEPITNITKKYTYELSNGFTFSTFNKLDDTLIKTNLKLIDKDTNVKYIKYNNIIDLQIKIINIISKGQLFEVKNDLEKIKITTNIDAKVIDGEYYLKINNIKEEDIDPTIAYKIKTNYDFIAYGFLHF